MEEIQFGLGVMIIGFTVVFVTLVALYFIMQLFNHIFSPKKEGQKSSSNTDNKVKEVVVSTEESVIKNKLETSIQEDSVSPEKQLSFTDDPTAVPLDVVAAITATLSVVLGKDENAFFIKDIRPIQGAQNAWSTYGKNKQLDLRANFNFFRRERK